MNVALDELTASDLTSLTASELNAAIDDTNFPKNNCVENGKKKENGEENGIAKTYKNRSFKREIPTPLKGVAFNENFVDIPGTPRTPRTSTTPGNCELDI